MQRREQYGGAEREHHGTGGRRQRVSGAATADQVDGAGRDPRTLGDGGETFRRDDNLLSLALTLPKKNKQPGEEDEDEPAGRYFVKKKHDGSGAIYEASVPWLSFIEHTADIDAARGPKEGFTFGFNVIVTDDDDGRGPGVR